MPDYEKQKVDALKDISKQLGSLVREIRKSNRNDENAIRAFGGELFQPIDEYDEDDDKEDVLVIHKAVEGGYNDVSNYIAEAKCDLSMPYERLIVSVVDSFVTCPDCKNL